MGLAVLGVIGLYLLISVAVVVGVIGYARRHGKSVKRWGGGAALMMRSPAWPVTTTLKAGRVAMPSKGD